jgi:hypothetical protein
MSEPVSDGAMLSDSVDVNAADAPEFDPANPINLVERSEDELAGVERVVIFRINGKPYTIPNETRPNVAMGYLYLTKTRGVAYAEGWLAEELLGAEGYEALINFKDLKQDQSNEIFKRARDIAFGRYDPKAQTPGNGSSTGAQRKRSGTRKSTPGASKRASKSSRTA